jgi:hypothetical protein
MKNTEGQKQVHQLFVKGVDSTTDPRLLSPEHHTVANAQNMRLDRSGAYTTVSGDVALYSAGRNGSGSWSWGMIWAGTRLVEFLYDHVDEVSEVWIGGVKYGSHANMPKGYLSIDYDPIGDDVYIAAKDRVITNVTYTASVPMVLNVQDMIDSLNTTKYTTTFDIDLYTIQAKVQMDQPVFISLEPVGGGGGLLCGSYSYSIRYVDVDGNRSAWGPSTPLIPVPKNNDTTSMVYKFIGQKVFGGEAVDGPTSTGIRIRFRVTNFSGYSYIEIRRIANKSGSAIDYVATPEVISLTKDSNGDLVDIVNNPFSVIDFVDRDGLAWITLSEQEVANSIAVDKAGKVRIYDNRIVMADITYKSRNITQNLNDIFLSFIFTKSLPRYVVVVVKVSFIITC